jgi:hypothetical protein
MTSKLGFGRVYNYSLAPEKLPTDRTLSNGMYLYTDFTYEPNTKRNALLESEILPNLEISCLRFWYYKSGQMSLEVKTIGQI